MSPITEVPHYIVRANMIASWGEATFQGAPEPGQSPRKSCWGTDPEMTQTEEGKGRILSAVSFLENASEAALHNTFM